MLVFACLSSFEMSGRAAVLSGVLWGKCVFELQLQGAAHRQMNENPDQKWHHSSRDLSTLPRGISLLPYLNSSEMQNCCTDSCGGNRIWDTSTSHLILLQLQETLKDELKPWGNSAQNTAVCVPAPRTGQWQMHCSRIPVELEQSAVTRLWLSEIQDVQMFWCS